MEVVDQGGRPQQEVFEPTRAQPKVAPSATSEAYFRLGTEPCVSLPMHWTTSPLVPQMVRLLIAVAFPPPSLRAPQLLPSAMRETPSRAVILVGVWTGPGAAPSAFPSPLPQHHTESTVSAQVTYPVVMMFETDLGTPGTWNGVGCAVAGGAPTLAYRLAPQHQAAQRQGPARYVGGVFVEGDDAAVTGLGVHGEQGPRQPDGTVGAVRASRVGAVTGAPHG